MKHHHNDHHAHSDGPQLTPHPTANTVCIAGTFNDWHPEAKQMRSLGSGRWLKETVLAPGAYEYCLVVDGHWIPDPMAPETVPNPFGGRNSVLRVACPLDAAHLVEAETFPLKNANKNETETDYEQTN